jgi:hypothetical protein
MFLYRAIGTMAASSLAIGTLPRGRNYAPAIGVPCE